MPKTKPNGADAIFRKIFDTVDQEESHVNIHIFDEFDNSENWSFGSDNFSHFETAGSVLEGKLLSGESKRVVVHIRERNNGKNLLYRILFTKDNTHFLSAEESINSDTTDAETQEENSLPLQENHVYLDSDFFSDNENKYFQNAETISMDDIIELNDEELDSSPFGMITDNDMEFYKLKSEDDFLKLEELFFYTVYGKKAGNLQSSKNKIKNALTNDLFKNSQNSFIAKNIVTYINILDDIGMDLDFTVMFLPLFDRLRFISVHDDGVFQIEIFFKDDLIRVYGLEGNDEDGYECTFIEESKLDKESLEGLSEDIEIYLMELDDFGGLYEEDLEKYGVEDELEYANLELEFFQKVYSGLNDDSFPTLENQAESFKKALLEEPFSNHDNFDLYNKFDDYADLLKELGLYDKKLGFYFLPPFEELKVGFGTHSKGLHFSFNIDSVRVDFLLGEQDGELIDTMLFSFDNEESMIMLKEMTSQM